MSYKIIEVYGHRGARAYAPENSILSYETALKFGVNYVDMDIVITKDEEIVVYHDLWINPDFTGMGGKFYFTSNKRFIEQMEASKNSLIAPYLVKNITLKELKQYDIGILNPDSPYHTYFPNQCQLADIKIPTLQETIDYVDYVSNKKVGYQIEIKNDPFHPNWTIPIKEIAYKIYTILKKNNLIKRVEVQAFDWNILYELQRLDHDIKTAYLISYHELGLNNPNSFKNYGVLSGGKMLKNYGYSLPQMIKKLGGSCYEPEDIILTKKDLDEAHELDLKVVTWTWPEHSGKIFDSLLIDKLVSWGVDGITTDDPARLNSILTARGYQTPVSYTRSMGETGRNYL